MASYRHEAHAIASNFTVILPARSLRRELKFTILGMDTTPRSRRTSLDVPRPTGEGVAPRRPAQTLWFEAEVDILLKQVVHALTRTHPTLIPRGTDDRLREPVPNVLEVR